MNFSHDWPQGQPVEACVTSLFHQLEKTRCKMLKDETIAEFV